MQAPVCCTPYENCRSFLFSPAKPKSPIRTEVTRFRSASQKMLSGFRSACTIRFLWMCRTLEISEPKTSAASESVRSVRCSQLRSVSRSFVGLGPSSWSGGMPINSISMHKTAYEGAAAETWTWPRRSPVPLGPLFGERGGEGGPSSAFTSSGTSQMKPKLQSLPAKAPNEGVKTQSLVTLDVRIRPSLTVRTHLRSWYKSPSLALSRHSRNLSDMPSTGPPDGEASSAGACSSSPASGTDAAAGVGEARQRPKRRSHIESTAGGRPCGSSSQ
mmetsp:Transcript_69928/g.227636  ORF Transcript_69928/g.227636 Transcript_69928/m.227636 type:complete len:273 (-) Transcript_69928:438-1256(-)